MGLHVVDIGRGRDNKVEDTDEHLRGKRADRE